MKSVVIWFTGLSGAGKSTIAELVRDKLARKGGAVFILDGDELRAKYPQPLGFGFDDVMENNRRAVEYCQKVLPRYRYVLVTIVSPIRSARENARRQFSACFMECYVKASINSVMQRDPKGHYARFKIGLSNSMIGLPGGLAYEVPEAPDILLDTDRYSAAQLAEQTVEKIKAFERSLSAGLPETAKS